MEEDAHFRPTKSALLQKNVFKQQIAVLEGAIKEAQDLIDYESANNPEIQYALDIIAKFLRRKRRICYGGTAINALLPKELKFYDEEKELPDYDFFTDDSANDIEEIVKDLNAAGFREVNQRIGMHAGTHKILVNFIPVADITDLDSSIYNILYKRSKTVKGIHFADPDFLRMMMYLELSRPRGEVARWTKVYERLALLNAAFPVKLCRSHETSLHKVIGSVYIPLSVRERILQYILENKRILAGADVALFYDIVLKSKSYHTPSIQWFLKRNGILVFMSMEAIRDAIAIRDLFGEGGNLIKIDAMQGSQEIVPERVVLSYKNMPFLMIIQEVACHSYNTITLKDTNNKLLIGSLETLITLYYSLALFTEDDTILQTSILCLCQKLVEMSKRMYKIGGKGPIPAFSISCVGYQKGYATLLREKVARIAEEKKKGRAKTQKRLHSKKRNRTMKLMM
jgi:hypothetical protein